MYKINLAIFICVKPLSISKMVSPAGEQSGPLFAHTNIQERNQLCHDQK